MKRRQDDDQRPVRSSINKKNILLRNWLATLLVVRVLETLVSSWYNWALIRQIASENFRTVEVDATHHPSPTARLAKIVRYRETVLLVL
jgi:hypothetical protein